MSDPVFKPVYVVPELGDLGRLPDGAIINAGGVSGHFTVDGKAVILKDGTASDGSGQVIITGTPSGPGSDVRGHEHVQSTPATMWIINHGRNTTKVQFTLWDENDELMFADVVKIQNSNTVTVVFHTAVTGRAILMLF
jgi:hypothetical protein